MLHIRCAPQPVWNLAWCEYNHVVMHSVHQQAGQVCHQGPFRLAKEAVQWYKIHVSKSLSLAQPNGKRVENENWG